MAVKPSGNDLLNTCTQAKPSNWSNGNFVVQRGSEVGAMLRIALNTPNLEPDNAEHCPYPTPGWHATVSKTSVVRLTSPAFGAAFEGRMPTKKEREQCQQPR